MGRQIAILGPIAVGKTSVGTIVAERLGLAWLDSDEQIEGEHNKTGRQISAERGVESLHAIELQMLIRALQSESSLVYSPAASVVDTPAGVQTLSDDEVMCVLLEADLRTLLARVSAQDHRRPIDRQELDRLMDERLPKWRALAAATFSTDDREPRAVADDIVDLYH
jgi:shikimate kinase